MRSWKGDCTGKALVAGMICLLIVSTGVAQVQPSPRRGRLRNQGGAPLKKVRPEAGDPLIRAAGADAKGKTRAAASSTYHYVFRLHTFDGNLLAASYYPSRLGASAPVVMLVHEANRSRKDFEEQVEGLKGLGLAEHLQEEGYAVFSMDLRGQGQNPRRVLNASDRILLVQDLQAAYMFLLDRHNRGDFNVAKLGVVAVGEGANLVAAWAYQPGASVSTEGRPGDLNALVMLSPFPEGAGYILAQIIPSLASRIPLGLLAGSKDNASKNAVESVRRLLERGRMNKVELFPSSLHGYKLLRLEPKVAPAIVKILEPAIKLRPIEWEPRYNLTPVTVSEIQTVQHTQPVVKPGTKKEEPKADAAAKAKPANAGENAPEEARKKPEAAPPGRLD